MDTNIRPETHTPKPLKCAKQVTKSQKTPQNKMKDLAQSVALPSLELKDPTPDIQELFKTYDKQFFWGVLTKAHVTVSWSKRLKSCVGDCLRNPDEIRLSEPILKFRPRKDLVETLLHEMIHAYLNVTHANEYLEHGPQFLYHMDRVNKKAGTQITVDHDFHEEADYYLYHWHCKGKCGKLVKSRLTRPPGQNDYWWMAHKKTCGGKFVKVAEPPHAKDQKKDKKKENKNPVDLNKTNFKIKSCKTI